MNIKTTKKIISKISYLKQKGVNVPCMIWGNHGIGKTSIVGQCAESMNFNFSVVNAANLTVEDLLGQIDGKGGYFKPDWFVEEKGKPTVYFLDELNRAPKYVLQGLYNFVNEGRIHRHYIRPCDIIVSACNPPTENYEVSEFEDKAFWARFAHIELHPEKDEFTDYLEKLPLKEKDGRRRNVVAKALTKSIELYATTGFDLPYKAHPDNRNLERCDHIFNLMTNEELEDYGMEFISSIVGYAAASVLFETWRESVKLFVEPEKLLTMKETDYPFKRGDLDAINMFNINLVQYMVERLEGKLSTTKISKGEQKGFIRFAQFIHKDQQYALIKQLTTALKNKKSWYQFVGDDDYVFILEIVTSLEGKSVK